jgi:hypothetical protein
MIMGNHVPVIVGSLHPMLTPREPANLQQIRYSTE